MKGYQFAIPSIKKSRKSKKLTKRITSANIAQRYMELQLLREQLSQEELRQSAR